MARVSTKSAKSSWKNVPELRLVAGRDGTFNVEMENDMKEHVTDLQITATANGNFDIEMTQDVKVKVSNVIWRLDARPSKTDHCAHTVGYLSKEEDADRWNGTDSTDSDDHVTWYYTCVKIYTSTMTDKELKSLKVDDLPRHFPYTGW